MYSAECVVCPWTSLQSLNKIFETSKAFQGGYKIICLQSSSALSFNPRICRCTLGTRLSPIPSAKWDTSAEPEQCRKSGAAFCWKCFSIKRRLGKSGNLGWNDTGYSASYPASRALRVCCSSAATACQKGGMGPLAPQERPAQA